MDLMNRHELVLSDVRFVVLDEADEMLDLGFLEDVETILLRCPSGRQTALFSATIPPEIKKLAEKRMFDPVTIKVRAAQLTIDTVEQFYVEAGDRDKPAALARVLKSERPEQAIIFARTKIGVDRLARSLNNEGVRVKALHGDMSQVEHLVGLVEHHEADVREDQLVPVLRSMTRPTVPTTTWPPCLSWATWLRIGAPPNTATTWMPRFCPYARSAWVTWMQSSRVGVSTSAWTSSRSVSTYWSSGNPKAAVFPVPVWACPITTWPDNSSGMACS